MPTYFFHYSNLNLLNKEKKNIAYKITRIHSKITGANKYFAQVIFKKNKKNDHFIGGKKISGPEIFIFGNIRSGRSKKLKDKLILELRDNIKKYLNIKKDKIWAYILDLEPNQMIEFGEVLPNSGEEQKWFNKLSKQLKIRLMKIDKN